MKVAKLMFEAHTTLMSQIPHTQEYIFKSLILTKM